MTIGSGKPVKQCGWGLLLCSGLAAGATPPSLEQLLQQRTRNLPGQIEVSTASRLQQSAAQAAQVTYLVTADDISRLQLRTLGEVLSLLPGLYVSSDSTYGYLTARGIGRPGDYNSRLLFLVDGTRVNDNIYDAGLIGSNFHLDVRLIERVEFIPGTGSALYGNNAYLGVVNIISKKVYQLQNLQLQGAISNQHQHDLLLSYGLRDPQGHEGFLAISHNQRGQIPLPEAGLTDVPAGARGINQDRNTKLAGSYSYRRFAITFAGVQRDRQRPALVGEQLLAHQVQNDVAFVNARYAQRLSQQLEWFGHFSSNRMHFKTVTPTLLGLTATRQPLNELIFDVEGKWTNLDQRLSYQPRPGLNWLAGLDLQRDHHQAYSFNLNELVTLSSVTSSNMRAGLFVQQDWQVWPAHRLLLGLRYDHSADNVRELSPKLGWIWQPSASDQWRFNFGRAFRAPNEYELETNRFYQTDLPEAEQTDTVELGWQRQWPADWHSHVTIYRNQIKNLITSNYGETTLVPFFNDQPVHAKGVELLLQRDWADLSELKLSVSVQQAGYNPGQRLTNSAEQLLKLQYYRPLWHEHWSAGYRLFAASARLSRDARLAGFARHDVSVRWQPTASVQWQLTLKNLTDRRQLDAPLPSAWPLIQSGRSVDLSVSWSLP